VDVASEGMRHGGEGSLGLHRLSKGMLSQDLGWAERLNAGLFPPGFSLNNDLPHQVGHLSSVLFR